MSRDARIIREQVDFHDNEFASPKNLRRQDFDLMQVFTQRRRPGSAADEMM
jgi:hypothetical protein